MQPREPGAHLAGYVIAMAYYALKRNDIADEVRAGLTRLLEETAGKK